MQCLLQRFIQQGHDTVVYNEELEHNARIYGKIGTILV
jgi:hypothetical protein